jgi:heme oxygenase
MPVTFPFAMTLLDRLRQESRAAHRRLEEQAAIPERIQDLDSYRELLEKFLGFYAPMENHLERLPGWAEWGYDPLERRKTAWLSLDLAALGRETSEIVTLPLCEETPRPESVAEGFGCAYVLEGATLGGRQISASLAGSAIPGGARNFFQSYGAQVGEKWSAFCESLERYGARGGDQDAVIHAASATFNSLSHWLAIPPPPAP